jgi:hypothetical protein
MDLPVTKEIQEICDIGGSHNSYDADSRLLEYEYPEDAGSSLL